MREDLQKAIAKFVADTEECPDVELEVSVLKRITPSDDERKEICITIKYKEQ